LVIIINIGVKMRSKILKTVIIIIALTIGYTFSEERSCASCGWENRSAVGLRTSIAPPPPFSNRKSVLTLEINWQTPLFGSNRLELGTTLAIYPKDEENNVHYRRPGEYDPYIEEYGIVASYLWTGSICGGFGWFVGPSVETGLWRMHSWSGYLNPETDVWVNRGKKVDEAWHLGAGPRLGIEYKFKVPISISMDIRPMLGLWMSRTDLFASIQEEDNGVRFVGGYVSNLGWGYSVKYVF
jgi:hypothetical protein